MLETKVGEVVISGTSAIIKDVDGAMNGGTTANGTLKLAENAYLAVSGNIWSRSNTGIVLEQGATLDLQGKNLSIINNSSENATFKATTNNGQEYSLAQTNYEIRNAMVVYNGTENATLSNKLTNATLVTNNAVAPADLDGSSASTVGTLTVNHEGNTLKGVQAYGGDVCLMNLRESTSLELLEIAAGRTVSAYVGSNTETRSDVTVTGDARLMGGAHLNASLTLAEGSTLDMVDVSSEAVVLTGALTFSGQVTLGNNLQMIMAEMKNWGDKLVLFTGLSDVILPTVTAGDLDSALVLASSVFSNVQNENLYVNYQEIGDVGSLMVINIPEPASATLSLTALMLLCARRRRKN